MFNNRTIQIFRICNKLATFWINNSELTFDQVLDKLYSLHLHIDEDEGDKFLDKVLDLQWQDNYIIQAGDEKFEFSCPSFNIELREKKLKEILKDKSCKVNPSLQLISQTPVLQQQ